MTTSDLKLVRTQPVDIQPKLEAQTALEPLYFARPAAQYQAFKTEIDAAIQRVLEGQVYILGPEVKAFEAEFAAWCGSQHGIGVANGTDAIHLALRALNIGAGDEVITTAHTAVATVAAIEMAGATPVFADIDAERYGLDPESVARAISPRTRAIVAVHLYGHPVDLGPLLDLATRHNLHLIEDCAQAHGALWNGHKVGSVGVVGCFSLYPTKNLGGIGDGGIVITADPALADRLRQLRQYGWVRPQHAEMPGWNSRLDELQAAILRVKLRHLDATTARRREIARRYTQALADLPLVLPGDAPGCAHVYHLYVLRSPEREALRAHLASRGIHAGLHYAEPVHVQPAYRDRFPCSLPVTERIVHDILSLPMYPELSDQDVDRVIDGIRGFYRMALAAE